MNVGASNSLSSVILCFDLHIKLGFVFRKDLAVCSPPTPDSELNVNPPPLLFPWVLGGSAMEKQALLRARVQRNSWSV